MEVAPLKTHFPRLNRRDRYGGFTVSEVNKGRKEICSLPGRLQFVSSCRCFIWHDIAVFCFVKIKWSTK